MNGVLVDSSVLLDVSGDDNEWTQWSAAVLAETAERRRLVINQIVYAEVSTRYVNMEDCEAILDKLGMERETLPWAAAFLAGKAFTTYRRRGGARSSPLPDFLIGAHAAAEGYDLLTRDPKRIRSYFPSVRLIAPGVR